MKKSNHDITICLLFDSSHKCTIYTIPVPEKARKESHVGATPDLFQASSVYEVSVSVFDEYLKEQHSICIPIVVEQRMQLEGMSLVATSGRFHIFVQNGLCLCQAPGYFLFRTESTYLFSRFVQTYFSCLPAEDRGFSCCY